MGETIVLPKSGLVATVTLCSDPGLADVSGCYVKGLGGFEAYIREDAIRLADDRVLELRAALTPPGHVLVGPDARERIARALWEHDRAKSGNHGWSSEWAGLEPGSWAQVYGFQADAVLRALGVRGGA